MKHKLNLRFFKGTLKAFRFEADDSWIEPSFSIEKNFNIVNINFTCRSYYRYNMEQDKLQKVDDVSLQHFLVAPFEELKIEHYPETEKRYHNNVYIAISLILFSCYFEGIKENEIEECFTESRIIYYRKLGTDTQSIQIFTNDAKSYTLSKYDYDVLAIFSTKLKNKKLSVFK